jgi:hypothetical protein
VPAREESAGESEESLRCLRGEKGSDRHGRRASPGGALAPRYYRANGLDVCGMIATLNDAQVSQAAGTDASSALSNLRETCRSGASRSAALAAFGLQAVQGLGDFLVARSKEEVLDFAVEMKAKALCEGRFRTFLDDSCKVLYPDGTGNPPDLESAADGRLTIALRRDLSLLAGRLLTIIVDKQVPGLKSAPFDEVLQAIGDGAVDAARDQNLSRFFDNALTKLPEDARTDFACQLSDGSRPSKAPCIAAFMLEVGSTAVAENLADPVLVIEDAAKAFCARFGKATTPPDTSGQCVFGAPNYPDINAQAVAMVGAADRLHKAMATSAVMGPSQVAGLQGIGAALFAAVGKLTANGASLAGGDVMKLLKDVIAFAQALANRDGGDALAAAQDIIVTVNKIDPNLAPDSKTFAFVLAIATAKSRDDVEAAFEAAAAPVGSYRRKYGKGSAPNGLWTINGFVGFSTGGLHPLHRAPDVEAWQYAWRLSAPVGLDVNLWGWSFVNLGIGVTVIDPLALTVVTKDGVATDANWASLFSLGGYLRVGLGGSPINLLAGGSYNPGLEPSGGCTAAGTTPCWRGAWQVGAGLVVDVPVIPIH